MTELDHILQQKFLDNTLWQWTSALAIFFIFWVALLFVRNKLTKRLLRLAAQTPILVDDLFARLVENTKSYFIFAASLYMGLKTLEFSDRFHLGLNKVFVVITLLQAAGWGSQMIQFWLDRVLLKRATGDSAAGTTVNFLGFLSKAILYTIILLMLLSNLGVNITALVTGLGVGGIAIGLAVQNILGDLLSSLAIVLDKPFVVGDSVSVDNFSGTIEHIGLKTTRIRSTTSEQIIFSNADLLKSRIRNYKRMNERCVQFSLFASYQTSAALLQQLPQKLSQIIQQQQNARLERCHLKSLGNNGAEYEIVYYISDSRYSLYMDTQQQINFQILNLFSQEKIQFGVPAQITTLLNPL